MSEKTENKTSKPIVAVFGATGYTGRFVIAELLRRGITPIAITRDADALSTANFSKNGVDRRQATIDDAASLDRALRGAQAVINCAGPFADTAGALVSAALRAGIHYVDVAAEQVITAKTLQRFDEPARKAGVAVVPAMAFFGGFADLMVTSLLGHWDTVDSIEILMGIDSWHPTQGTRNTIAAQQFVIEVVVRRGNESRRAISRGRDSYAVTAPLVCEAVSRLLKGNIPAGAHAPGEIFAAKEFLEALGPDHASFEIVAS